MEGGKAVCRAKGSSGLAARLEREEVAVEQRRVVACAEAGAGAGTRNPAQAAQVVHRRSGPEVHRPPQPRLRPGHADGGVARVRANRGSRSAGVDGQTARYIEQVLGVEKFLDGLREELRSGSFRPLPVKERLIPKRGGKQFRRLGVPALRDRVVQAALKLVLEPIFEADFQPCSYGFRPGRRMPGRDRRDSLPHHIPSHYEWIVEADIKACFDELSHSAILDRVRRRIRGQARAGVDQGVPQGRDHDRAGPADRERSPARRKAGFSRR